MSAFYEGRSLPVGCILVWRMATILWSATTPAESNRFGCMEFRWHLLCAWLRF